jgi:hypothetical protein
VSLFVPFCPGGGGVWCVSLGCAMCQGAGVCVRGVCCTWPPGWGVAVGWGVWLVILPGVRRVVGCARVVWPLAGAVVGRQSLGGCV